MIKVSNLRKLGFIQIILSGVCFGALGFFGKKAYAVSILPGELLALRYSISAILTGLLILITNPKSFFLSRFELISSLLLGIFGYALFSNMFFIALSGLSASLTVLLLYTYPVMVSFLSQYILHETLDRKSYMALLLTTLGMLGLVWGEWSVSDEKYILIGIGSAFFYSLYIMYSRKYLRNIKALPSSFYVQLGAGFILSAIHFKDSQRPFEILQSHGVLVISMAIICSLMAMTLFLAGLRHLTSSEASILSTTEPLFGVIIAILFLGEKLTLLQFLGGSLILLGMILLGLKKEGTVETPPPGLQPD